MNAQPTVERIEILDAIRGFAVMGILLMNIVDMAMPGYAYYDPTYYGGAEGLNFAAYAINYALFDGKMRGLFTMMFGASMALICERALKSGESPARVHYSRMFWLFVFGMIHAWLIWYGDILVLYSVCGALAYIAWRWSNRVLIGLGILLLAVKLAMGAYVYHSLDQLRQAAAAPDAPAEVKAEWQAMQVELTPPPAQGQLEAYRGTYMDALEARVPFTVYILTVAHPFAVPDTLALIAFGIVLYRVGFFSGAWSKRSYQHIALWGYLICVPLHWPLLRWNVAADFSLMALHYTETIHLVFLRTWLTMAHASVFVLFMQSGYARWLAERVIAAGRAAFTNYLGTSIVVTLIFNGYGLGLYGYLERWHTYFVVLFVWALILLWSKPWLERYQYGPLEWLWRSLARWHIQPWKRRASEATATA